MSSMGKIASVSTVERDGAVGGDGAADSWSVRVLWEGDDPTDSEAGLTLYSYAYDARERFHEDEWEERGLDEYPWDVEEMSMSADDVSYEHPSPTGFRTREEADRHARFCADQDRAHFLALLGTERAR